MTLWNRRTIARFALLALAFSAASGATAQESLRAILDRGYIAHWLVCGPFPSDVPGGLLAAVQNDTAVLGDTDFMTTAGGIARMRPEHLMRVRTPAGGEAIWQRAGATDSELDLKPFFPASPDGVAYAAFYTDTPQRANIYLDVQSPLGVRVWANGFPVHAYQPGPVDEAGVTQVVVPLRAGSNLVVLEVPGADYEAIAQSLGVTTQQLTASTMANRPRLRKTSGFALSTRVAPALPLGGLFYVPKLDDAGTFSGAPGDRRQDTWLTLYNGADAFSEPIDVLVSTPGMSIPDLIEVDRLDAKSAQRVALALPIEGLAEGAQLRVSVRLHSGGVEGAFTDTVLVRPGTEDQGVVRVITGHTVPVPEGDPVSAVAGAYLESFRRQILFWREGGGYGFDLGYASEWRLPYVAHPDLRAQLLAAAQQGGATVRSQYAPVDERIAGGHLLWRNLQLGMQMDQEILHSTRPHHLPWDSPGIAPQTIQLLRRAALDGLISNNATRGLPPLARQLDLDGGEAYHRHKLATPGPGSAAELEEMAALQRRELLKLGIPTDVLVVDNVVPAPEPFYRGSIANLARSFPRIALDDGGGTAFFEEVAGLGREVQAAIPPAAPYLNQGQPGDLMTWPMLIATHARAAAQVRDAESLATLASIQGAEFPHAAMDLATRQLAFYSTPDYLSAPANRDDALDTLAGYREVAELAGDVLERSAAYLAARIDTAGAVPLNQGAFQAVVVFNPAGQTASLPVQVLLPQPASQGLTLTDAAGTPVPFARRDYRQLPLVEFVANNVPSLGYQTYFIKAEGERSAPVEGADLQIENDTLALFVDPETGAIATLQDKRTKREISGGLLNQIVFLNEDEARNQGGRELWTGPAGEPPAKPASITSEHAAFRESILIATPILGGTIEQRYTLYTGLPWVVCDTRLNGVTLRDKAAFASFALPHAGRSLVLGERLGALVGARGQTNETIRTQGADNTGGIVAYPAHAWVAITPNDAIQVGRDGAIPWEPAIIVHGPDAVLARAARDLQAALFTRGIPSIIQPDRPEKLDFLWTDATTEMDSNAYLRAGYRMRIVIGSPDQNTFCGPLLAQLPAAALADFAGRIPQGARVFLHDTKVPNGLDPVPTLMLAGLTPSQSASLADGVTEAVASGRGYLLPPSAFTPGEPAKAAGDGCAILFPGAMGVSQQNDGRLFLGLAHRSALEKNATGARLADMMNDQRFTYAICPFEGTWRAADVPAMAEAAFAVPRTVLTDIHPGALPASRSFLGVSSPGLRLEGIRPAGWPQTVNTRAPFHPRNGFTMLAWETRGEPWDGEITGTLPLLEARTANAYDAPRDALTVANGAAALPLRGFRFQPLWLLPAVAAERDGLGALGRTMDPYGVIETRYWDEHRGAAPLQNLPLGVLLRGTLAGDALTVEAIISNHLSDKPIEGTARLSASSGISFGPQEFTFSLPPGRQHVEPIQLAYTPGTGPDRGIAVEVIYERQTYRDVIGTNEAPFALELSRNGAQLRVEVRNNSSMRGEGYLDIIAAPQFWTERADFPDTTILPRRAAISVPAYKAQTVIFTVSDATSNPEVAVKLAANGAVQYLFFSTERGTPPEDAPAGNAPVPPPPRPR